MSGRFRNIKQGLRDYEAIGSAGIIGGEILVRKAQVKSKQKRRGADAIMAGWEADIDMMEAALETAMSEVKTEIGMVKLEIVRQEQLDSLYTKNPQIAAAQQRMIAAPEAEYEAPMTTYGNNNAIDAEATKIAMAYPKGATRQAGFQYEKTCKEKMRKKGFSPDVCDQVIERVHELMTD